MNRFPRLLCIAALASAAFAQSPKSSFVTSDPSLASEVHTTKIQTEQVQTDQARTDQGQPMPKPAAYVLPAPTSANQPELQLRSIPEHTVLPIATVLRLKLTRDLSTASARPGQQFTATLTRSVEMNGRIVIPAGATVNCRVGRAHGARRFAGKPAISIKALRARTPDGEELNFSASVVDTDNPRHLDVDEEGSVRGASPNPMNQIEMGSLAGAGAIAGVVIGGPEGLLIGTATGVAVAAGHIVVKHRDLTLPAGTELILELDAPATISRPQMGGM
jgi:hypothetical protein